MGRGDAQALGNKLRAAAEVGQAGEQWGKALSPKAQPWGVSPHTEPGPAPGLPSALPCSALVCAEAGRALSSVPGWTLSWGSNQLTLAGLCKGLNFALLEAEMSGLL